MVMRLVFFLVMLGAVAVPIAAQDEVPQESERSVQRRLLIFGADKCPANTICVVAPEEERYRIPKRLRAAAANPKNDSWAVKSQSAMAEGRSGTGSCSASGAGGWTGCWAEEMRKARAERKQGNSDNDLP
jgi:hypothetical protein